MGLHGYARTHAGIAVVLTLASQVDAFAQQTQTLTRLLSAVQGQRSPRPPRSALLSAPPAGSAVSWRATP